MTNELLGDRWKRVVVWFACGLLGLPLVMAHVVLLLDGEVLNDVIVSQFAIDLLFGSIALAFLPAALRRLGGATHAVILAGAISTWGLPAACVAIMLVASRRQRRPLLMAGFVFAAGGALQIWMDSSTSMTQFELLGVSLVVLTVFLIPALIGHSLGARAELLRSLRERAELTEQAKREREERGRVEERARISREMHDALAHRLSLLSLHAGALETRPDLDHETIAASCSTIRELAADASRELRQILAVLHADGTRDTSRAEWAEVMAVINRERDAGAHIAMTIPYEWEQDFHTAPQTLRHAVLRMVEEGLTNARRHAPGAPVDIRFHADDGVSVRIRNPAPATAGSMAPGLGRGLGLAGMRERAALAGGWLRAGAAEGEFVVEAWVPWNRA